MNVIDTFERITSRRNPLVAEAASLATREGRESHGLCWAEGAVAADYALSLPAGRLKAVLLSEEATPKCRELAEKLARRGARGFLLTPECFEKASALRHPEGLGLLVATKPPLGSPEELPADRPVGCLWQLQDPGNLGTILRSARAFGCRSMLLVTPCVSPFSPAAVRASAGAALDMDFLFLPEKEAFDYLLAQGDRVAALTGEGVHICGGLCYNEHSKLIVSGNEPHGLPEEVRKALPSFSIPMERGVESLNVTAASAIAYFLFWSRSQNPPEKA